MTQRILKGSEYIGCTVEMMAEKIGIKVPALLEGTTVITRKLAYESAGKCHSAYHDATLFYLEFSDGETMFFYGCTAKSHGDSALVRALADRLPGSGVSPSEVRNQLCSNAEQEYDSNVPHRTFTKWRDQLFEGVTYAYSV